MGPSFRQLVDLASLHQSLDSQQAGQFLLGGRSAKGTAGIVTQEAGATGSGKPFAQLPTAAACLEADLHLRQAGMEARSQLFHTAACGARLEEQAFVERFHHSALAGLVGPTDQGEAGIKAQLQQLVLADMAQNGRTQTHDQSALERRAR